MKIKVETEKKYYCLEPERLIKIATSLNFKEVSVINEIDEYFTDINSDFIRTRTCLRIRKTSNEMMEVTYKGKSNSLLGQYCKLENNISCDIKEYDNYVNLFASLGYYSYVTVEKDRLTYELKGKYDYSIMIDRLENIGGFVEFEIVSDKNNSKTDELKKELNLFISQFDSLKLKEANKPYRDIVANHVYSTTVNNKEVKKLYINLDNYLSFYEKDFFKKYKDKIQEITKTNIKWGIYKKNREFDNKICGLVDDYLDNLIFDCKELLVCMELLIKSGYDICFITKINELFFTHLFGKLNINIENVIYINDENMMQLVKKYNIDTNNSIIINNKTLKEINSILLILYNN